jgi:hypothetical protein
MMNILFRSQFTTIKLNDEHFASFPVHSLQLIDKLCR